MTKDGPKEIYVIRKNYEDSIFYITDEKDREEGLLKVVWKNESAFSPDGKVIVPDETCEITKGESREKDIPYKIIMQEPSEENNLSPIWLPEEIIPNSELSGKGDYQIFRINPHRVLEEIGIIKKY